jgi:hypothetical protein
MLTALIFNGTGIYTSTNAGVNWSSNNAPRKGWTTVATSADGKQQIAAAPFTVSSAEIYRSTNSGASWTPEGMPVLSWSSVASSADGGKLYAAVNGGGIYTSQSTPAPALRLTRLQGELVLSWIVPSADFALQQNSDLSTTNWVVVSNAPVINLTNLQNEVRLPFSGNNKFYRLATP